MTDTTRESVERFETADKAEILWKDPDGFWVKHSDYAALLTRAEAAEAERDALQAKLAVAVEALKGFASWNECWPGNINLEAERRKARAAVATLTADTPKEGKDQ